MCPARTAAIPRTRGTRRHTSSHPHRPLESRKDPPGGVGRSRDSRDRRPTGLRPLTPTPEPSDNRRPHRTPPPRRRPYGDSVDGDSRRSHRPAHPPAVRTLEHLWGIPASGVTDLPAGRRLRPFRRLHRPAFPLAVDSDLAVDGLAALQYLLGRPEVAIAAITVSGTGEVRCERLAEIADRRRPQIAKNRAEARIPPAVWEQAPRALPVGSRFGYSVWWSPKNLGVNPGRRCDSIAPISSPRSRIRRADGFSAE